MFEKEAGKKGKYYDWNCNVDNTKAERIWKDGAEFGYNKCFEQIRKIVNEDTRLDCIIPELLRLQRKL